MEPIAIVGMACLLPKAPDLASYWRNILDASDCTSELPDDHSWRADEHFDADPAVPDKTYCRRGGFIDKVPFDPMAFGLPPNILDAVDTSQLLSLIVAREALKDAGIDPDKDNWPRQRTSCIMGITGTQELAITLGSRLHGPTWRKAMLRCGVDGALADRVVEDIGKHFPEWQEQSFPGLLGNVVAGRIANRLDLGGTNCVVDAACASSLAAIQLSIADLQAGKSDLAISGGVDTLNDIFMYMCFSKTPALSKTGHSRPFDANADGTLIAEGIAIAVMKRLSDAERDGDRVYAVIKGLGTSSDGRYKSIYAPNSSGQAVALRRAYEDAGFPLETIELIEAHGTGTKAGDIAEIEGLKAVFADSPRPNRHIAIGSVKSQIGHTKSAAGAAGLLKAALALHQRVLPPTAKVTTVNPKMGLEKSKLYVNSFARPWIRSNDFPRRAGVSAFGFGGSNFHLALEEHGSADAAPAYGPATEELFLFGAESSQDLSSALQAGGTTLAQASRDVLSRWKPASWVAAFTAETLADLQQKLEVARSLLANGGGEKGGVFVAQPKADARRTAVLFPGQGSQYTSMGRTLALRHATFRSALDRAETAFVANGKSLAEVVYPIPAFNEDDRQAQEAHLTATEWAQPAIGAISKAMFELLRSFGVQAEAFAGHSYGELVALHAAGVLDEASFFAASIARGEAMSDRGGDRGTMAAVAGDPATVDSALLGIPDVGVANRNHPRQTVISGTKTGIALAMQALTKAGLTVKALSVSAAFHSPLVADAKVPFALCLQALTFAAPDVPVYANTSARPYPSEPDAMRQTLADQITAPVDFVGIVKSLYESGVRTFVECGPKGVLAGLLRQNLRGKDGVAIVSIDAEAERVDGDAQFKRALAHLAARGVPVDIAPLLRDSLPQEPRTAGSKATVWLGGANYRKPETISPPAPKDLPVAPKPVVETVAQAPVPKVPVQAVEKREAPPVHAPTPSISTPTAASTLVPSSSSFSPPPGDEMSNAPVDPTLLAALLDSTRQGLLAFQQTQERTALVHAEFLKAHARANDSFSVLFASHARLVELAAGADLGEVAPAPRALPVAASAPRPAMPDTSAVLSFQESFLNARPAPVDSGRVQMPQTARPNVALENDLPQIVSAGAPVARPVARSEAPPAPAPKAAAKPTSSSRDAILSAMLDTVAEKTGYPKDMLELSMDLEADLGIDSIKRVEILSAVQEQIPGLPELDNDKMSALRTVGEVVEYLSAAVGGTPVVPSVSAPVVPSVSAPVAAPATGGSRDAVVAAMLETVSEKTGYPLEMLELSMDLEADLGIDSIKRVEILSAVQEKVPGLPELDNEQLSALRSVGDVVDHLAAALGATPQESVESSLPSRKEVHLQPAPLGQRRLLHGLQLISADRKQVAAQLAEALERRGVQVQVIDPDWTDPTQVRAAVFEGAAGVIHLAALGESGPDLLQRVKGALWLAQGLGPNGFFCTISGLGGGFGYDRVVGSPVEGALAGLTKTLAQEWPSASLLALDIDPNAEIDAIADELLTDRSTLEIGLSAAGPVTPTTVARPVPPRNSAPIRPGEGVVVTGGARGVTAAVVLEMARRWKPALLLLGRSPLSAEPSWATGVPEAQLKATCMADARSSGRKLTPKELDQQVSAVLATREVQQTLAGVRAAGATVAYAAVDARDAAAVGTAIQSFSAPIVGIVHGAGVLADRLAMDKTVDQLDAVFGTKVDGLDALLANVDIENLSMFAIFGSVAGRYGNRGQCDYAMANEALAKTSEFLVHSGVPRVRCFAWGPWEGGMVTPALKRQFEARGMELISLAGGARLFCDELESSSNAVEVVVGGPDHGGPLVAPSPTKLSGQRAFSVDPKVDPFLTSHQIGGKAVLPMAMALEWIVAAAAHKGLHTVAVRQFQVLRGVVLDRPEQLRLDWAEVEPARPGVRTLKFELTTGTNGTTIRHYQAMVDLSDQPAPAIAALPSADSEVPFPLSIEEAYRQYLFHGPAFRAIEAISGWSPSSISASIAGSPPSRLGKSEPWTTDPLAVDSCLQLLLLWAREQRGSAALPNGFDEFVQVAPFPADGVRCQLELLPTRTAGGKFNACFQDRSGRVIARINGGSYATNPALNATFQSIEA